MCRLPSPGRVMERGTGFPCRVYAPHAGFFATALMRDSVGVVIVRDSEDGPQPNPEWDPADPASPSVLGGFEYAHPDSIVEVTHEDAELGRATLIDGRVVLVGSTEVAPETETQ